MINQNILICFLNETNSFENRPHTIRICSSKEAKLYNIYLSVNEDNYEQKATHVDAMKQKQKYKSKIKVYINFTS